YNMDGNLFEGTGLSAAEAGSLASQSSLLKLINYGQIVTADTVAFLASAQEQLGVIPQSNEVRNTVWICPDSSRALLCELQEKRKALESVAQAIESHFGSNDMRTGAQKKFLADLRSSLAQVKQALQSLAAAPEGVVQCHSHAAFSATFNREFQAHSETIELTALMTDRSARQTEMQEEGDPIKRSALAGELAMIDARIEILTIESERRALQRSRLILLAHKETGKVDQTEFSRSMLRLEAEIKQADDERGKAIKNELELKARNLTECVARTRSQITEESRKSMRRLILGEQAELPDDALSEADRAKLKDFQRIKDYGALVFQQLESVLANAESSPSTATALGDFEAASRGLARLSKMVDAYAVEHKVDLRSTEQASLLLRKAKTLAELFETRAKENELAAGLTSAIDQTVLESDTEPQAIKDTVHEHCELHCEFELGLARQQRALARLAKKAREELALIEKEYRELDPDDPQQAERCKVLENRISEKKKELEQLEAKSAALHHKHAQGSSKFTQELGQLDLHENTRRAVAQLAAVYDAQIAQYWGIFEQNNIEYTRSVDRLDTALMYRWTPDMSLYLFGKTMYTSTELGSPYYIIQNQPPAQSTPVFSSNHEYQIPVVQIQPPPLNEAIRILPFLATVFPSELTRRVEGQSKEKKERQENEHLVERIRRIEGREVWTDINGDIAAHERLNALRSDVLLSMEEKKKRDKHKITA
ncbi:MAG TPA: hypothetical protein PLP17_01880, partial [Oligoflexia bacterium]|nr:hypothetical protein [Oligoflexia bacterium]